MTLYYGVGRDRPVVRAADLRGYLPADKRHHYRDGYSMAELAKCWVNAEGRLPPSVSEIVRDPSLDVAHFEYPVSVLGGGISMTDVMAFVPAGVIAVEGKARESFDLETGAWVRVEAVRNPRSVANRERVVQQYAEALGVDLPDLHQIRYQLLHRTLAAARTAARSGGKAAWMIVQSFAPTDCEEHVRNRADFAHFVDLVGGMPVLDGIPVKLAWIDERVQA